MKPFNLDSVLKYRHQLENQAQSNFFAAKEQEALAKKRVQEMVSQYNNLLAERDKLQNKAVSIMDVIQLENKIAHAKQQISKLKDELQKKAAQSRKAGQQLVARSRERQAMEKLKEKQNQRWRKYLDKKEAAMLDEIAILKHKK
ncbi:MAG: flagellar export protein FliJ [Deltaproteobacteria bacterium]|nr:MAG: flagellar export protein FliJ [Deltaproteobacteria bacterium]